VIESMGSFRSPFVGRERELAALEAHLDRLADGAGGVVLIAGEPGIGKTRLSLELAERARSRGSLTLFGRAYETEGMPPYLPFAEALREYMSASPEELLRSQLGSSSGDVAIILPDVARRLPSLTSVSTAGGELERYQLFESVSEFTLNVARETPGGLVLVLDDLQWADASTLQLLLHLARKLTRAPLLIVGTYRTVGLGRAHPLTDVLAELSRERLSERLQLQALSVSEATALIARLSNHDTGEALVKTVYRETEGNPFFMEEVVRHLNAEGYDLSEAGASPSAWSIPDGIRQVIGRRLEHPGRHPSGHR
jgi:predicted ATPase